MVNYICATMRPFNAFISFVSFERLSSETHANESCCSKVQTCAKKQPKKNRQREPPSIFSHFTINIVNIVINSHILVLFIHFYQSGVIKLLVRRNGFHMQIQSAFKGPNKNSTRMRKKIHCIHIIYASSFHVNEYAWLPFFFRWLWFCLFWPSKIRLEMMNTSHLYRMLNTERYYYEHRKFIIILMIFGSFFILPDSWWLPFLCQAEKIRSIDSFCRHVIFIRCYDRRYI